jgi:hypothetical protein
MTEGFDDQRTALDAALNRLDPGRWHVLHDVDMSDGCVDRVVIGSPGVFTISCRPARGSHARSVAERLSAATARSVRAFPVHVCEDHDGHEQPSDCFLVSVDDLESYLESMAPHMDDAGVRSLYRAAQATETWGQVP